MFYLREIPMLMKHVQERGGDVTGTLGGTADMNNKTLFEPIIELLRNRNYYGRQIWDTNAPAYQQLMQALTHIKNEQISPMSFTGAERASGATGTLLERIGTTSPECRLAYLGFGPAPSYASRSALQNRIAYLYQQTQPQARPYEDPEVTAGKQSLMAKQRGDPAEIEKAYDNAIDAGLSKTYLRTLGEAGASLCGLRSPLPGNEIS
jgi:hypothetical protein